MEPDRYQSNRPLYIFGMVNLLVSTGLFLLTLYLLPYLLFEARYDVPEFVSFWQEYLITNYGTTPQYALTLISVFLTFSCFVFGLGAYYASSRIDNALHEFDQLAKKPGSTDMLHKTKESQHVFLKILMLIVLLYVVIYIVHWILKAPFSFI